MSSSIHNPHAVQRLARQARALFKLELLKYGPDAVIQCTHRKPTTWLDRIFHPGGFQDRALPICPTAQHRLDRYHAALALHHSPEDRYEERELRGYQVKWEVRRRNQHEGQVDKVARLDDWRFGKRTRR